MRRLSRQGSDWALCKATTRIGGAKELDTVLKGWIKQAYDAAG